MCVCIYTSDLPSQKKGAVFYKGAHTPDLIKHFTIINACVAVDEHNLKQHCEAILYYGFDYSALCIGTLVFRGIISAHSSHTRALFERHQNQQNNRRCIPQIRSSTSVDL